MYSLFICSYIYIKYVWSVKDKNILYNIKWQKIKQARSYSNVTKRCNLCLWEKYFIICKPEMSTLNIRSELISNCRHSKKFPLKTVLALLYQSHLRMTRHWALFYIFKFCLSYYVSDVDITWDRPWPRPWCRSWPTLLPGLWPTGGQIVKNINKATIRVEGVSFLTQCPAIYSVPNELSVVLRTI